MNILTVSNGFLDERGAVVPRLSQACRVSDSTAAANQKKSRTHVDIVNESTAYVVKSATENYLSARYRTARGIEADVEYAAVFTRKKAQKFADIMNASEKHKSFKHFWGIALLSDESK